MSEFDPFFGLDLAFVIREVCEVHHGGLRVDSLLQVFARFDDHELYTRGAQLMVEGIAVRLLNNDF